MTKTYYFLIYDNHVYNNYVNNLLESVKKFGKEFKIIVFDDKDIDPAFKNTFKEIFKLPRGAGYWLWKPYIIHETLKKIKEDDVVLYLDCKYVFIKDFYENIKNCMENTDLFVWKNKPNERVWYMKNWCKMDVILKYDMYDKVFIENAEDCWSGAIVIKKNQNTLNCIQEWLDMCSNREDVSDSPSKSKNSELFKEHRHDQALFSIVLHKHNYKLHYFEKDFLQNVRCPF